MTLKRMLIATAALSVVSAPAFAQAPAATPVAKAPAQAPAAAGSDTAAQAPATPTTAAPMTPAPTTTAPAAEQASASSAPAAKVVAQGDLVQTAQASGQFNTFLKAAEATNLTNLLKTQKNITVFAPTDAAFAALPAGELDRLMLPENKAQLQKLLIYHMVNAPVTSTEFKGSTRSAATVAGPSVELKGGDQLMVNDADIVQADIAASNGVMHVIDKVLSPTGSTTTASADAAGAAASANAPAAAPEPSASGAATPTPAPQATPKAQPPAEPKGN